MDYVASNAHYKVLSKKGSKAEVAVRAEVKNLEEEDGQVYVEL